MLRCVGPYRLVKDVKLTRLESLTLQMRDYVTPSRPEKAPVSLAVDNSEFNKKSDKSLKPFSAVPGPKGLPIIGTLWDYIKKDGFKLNKLYEVMQQRAKVYGPIFKEKIGPETLVVISDPKEYLNVVRADGKYPNRMEMYPTAHYLKKRGLTLGTLNGQGEEWYRSRVILAKKLLKPKEIVSYIQPMNEVSDDFVKRLRKLSASSPTVPDLEMELFRWSFETIGMVVFEERIGCLSDSPPQLADEFITNLRGFVQYLQKLLYSFPLYKVYPTKSWKIFENYLDNTLRISRGLVNKKLEAMQRQKTNEENVGEKNGENTGENSAFLTYLLENFKPDEAKAHCMDIINGGVETTSTGLLWMLYYLARNPEAQNALYLETMRLTNGGSITEEHLRDMHYARACLKETFRITPLISVTSRRLATDISVCGYRVPKGTHCQANLYTMGRNPDLFPDPQIYKPERFLRENNSEAQIYLSNLIFGHGPRMCLGRRIAEQEIYILLSKIIQQFKLEHHGEDIHPVLNLIMTPDRPMKLKFIPRN